MKTKNKHNNQVSRQDLLSEYRLLTDLMSNIPDVIYFKDRKGKIILVNDAHAKGLGLKPEQVIGKTDFDIFSKERAEAMSKDDGYVMQTGKPIIDKIERATRPDGMDNYVSTTKIPRFNEKGKVIGLIGITRDITRRMQLENAHKDKIVLEKKLESLEELNKLKSEFISIVSHELRTPLAIIKEAVELVFDEFAGAINEKQKELLRKSKDNIERLRHIIEELLDMSRIERDRFKLHYSLLNLNHLIKDSSVFFKKAAFEKDIDLEYVLPNREVNVFVDPERINQVIVNLLNNAIKFTERGGKIKVELKVLENKIRIGVIDTGIGIAKAELPKIFNKFVQVSKLPGLDKKGLGLGLAISKQIVEKHGGEIWAESKLGVGSRFYFTLLRFYTLDVLDKQVRSKINDLLAKGISVFLVNLVIVNYSEFKQRIKIKPAKLFSDFKDIISGALNEPGLYKSKEKPQFVLNSPQRGECSIILPDMTEKAVVKLCDRFKDDINHYLAKNTMEEVFIAIGILSYEEKVQLNQIGGLPENLYVKEIYIGSEKRQAKRTNYKLNMEVLLPIQKTENSQTIDISEGGICFKTQTPLQTDAIVEVKLAIPDKKCPLRIKTRVAWIRKIEGLLEAGKSIYKVGVEFMGIKKDDKNAISRLIKKLNSGR